MLSPYWYDLFERLSYYWQIRIFVAQLNEPNREYAIPDFTKFGFVVAQSRNVMVDVSRFGWKTKYLHLQWGLWRDLRDFGPDVILANELGPRTILAKVYGRTHSVPVVPWICVSKHSERNNSFLRERIRSLLVRKSRSVCTNLTEAKEYLIDVLRMPEQNIYATPYAVDVKKFSTAVVGTKREAKKIRDELALNRKVFLYVGQMIDRKGLKHFFHAIGSSTIDLKEVSFLLVGGKADRQLATLLNQMGSHWKNLPFVQPGDLYKFYAAADVFFFPSLEDEWGIVLNEAAAASLPLLSSKYAAATRDLVRDEINGKVFDPLDAESTRVALSRILSLNDNQIKMWGSASQELANAVDIAFTASNMNAALHKAIGQRSHSS